MTCHVGTGFLMRNLFGISYMSNSYILFYEGCGAIHVSTSNQLRKCLNKYAVN